MNLKVRFFSAVRRFGVSKKTNNSYDMIQLFYAVPLETGKFGAMTVEGSGLSIVEMEANLDVINQCVGISPMSEVEIILEPNPRNPNKTLVAEVKKINKVSKVA